MLIEPAEFVVAVLLVAPGLLAPPAVVGLTPLTEPGELVVAVVPVVPELMVPPGVVVLTPLNEPVVYGP
jgi:hypothetical protein